MTSIFSGLRNGTHILVRSIKRCLPNAAKFVSRVKKKTPNDIYLTVLLGVNLLQKRCLMNRPSWLFTILAILLQTPSNGFIFFLHFVLKTESLVTLCSRSIFAN